MTMKQRKANFRNNLLRSLLCSNLVLLILGISSIPGFAGEIDLHYDADKLLFTMPKGPTWQIFEIRTDGPGLSLAEPEQPAVRVSWQRAMDFCRWISQETGMNFTLPTEAQWQYACRAGLQSPLSYGEVDADFSQWANVVDSNERKANCFIISAIRMASL